MHDTAKACGSPMVPYQAAAERWVRARERMFDARSDAARAEQARVEAEKEEQEAWYTLENEAGRSKPCEPVASFPARR